ncbi:MAG: ribonuclease HI [Spirochaetaceae bacterium]|jgi:ribonuclease HI|nr:ribonuclease HI [Spirochaetaceae bacterium]
MEVHIYTDGGCSGNPGPGGWAYIILRQRGKPDGGKGASRKAAGGTEILVEKYGGSRHTTNNRMELTAALSALEMLRKLNIAPKTVVVFTDSQYVQKGMTEWLPAWKEKNWINSDRQPVKNQDLWMKLDELAPFFSIQWNWVKGHDGNELNERCDALTQKAIEHIR